MRSVHCSRYFSLYFVWFCWVSVFSKRRTCVRFLRIHTEWYSNSKTMYLFRMLRKKSLQIPQYIFVISNISDRHLLSKILISHFLCIIKINQIENTNIKRKTIFENSVFFFEPMKKSFDCIIMQQTISKLYIQIFVVYKYTVCGVWSIRLYRCIVTRCFKIKCFLHSFSGLFLNIVFFKVDINIYSI